MMEGIRKAVAENTMRSFAKEFLTAMEETDD
jgi:queuine/archaeosine tRNA-ribosyltransferase